MAREKLRTADGIS